MGFSSFGSGLSKHTSVSQTNRVFPANLFVPGLDVGLGADQQPRTRLMAGFLQLGAGGSSVLDTEIARFPPVGGNTAGRPGANGRVFERQGLFNVKDYGAVGDGVVDDRAAIQAAIDACEAAGGGVVYFPKGSYGVNCTTVGLILPFDVHIVLKGDNVPTSIVAAHTRIIRSAGSATLVAADPAGAASASCRVSMVGIELNGNNTTGRIAYLRNLGQSQFHQVRFVHQSTSATVPAVYIPRPWNVRFSDCDFHTLGNNNANGHAVVLDALRAADGGVAGDTANTVHFVNCEWEGNRGADLRIDGEGVNKASHIVVAGNKLECGNAPSIGRTAPVISLGLHQNCHFSSNVFYLGGSAAAPVVRVDNVVGSVAATFGDCTFSGPTGQPFVDQNGGMVSCHGCLFANYSGQTAWDIASTVAAGRAQGAANIYYDTGNRFVDARAGGAGPTNQP